MPAPVLLLKTARSGSSWLAALLASIIGPMKSELVHWAKPSEARELENRMAARLLGHSSFSINVKNTPCVNYSHVTWLAQAAQAKPRTLLLERCNVVKHAISYMRSHLVAALCGGVHPKPNCSVLEPHALDLDRFRNALICTYHRSRLARLAYDSVTTLRTTVVYEDLQRDEARTLATLREFVGASPTPAPRLEVSVSPTELRDGVPVVKSGSDDLRAVVTNSAQVLSWLSLQPRGACLAAQFEERGARCTPCTNPWPEESCDQVLFDSFHDESGAVCDQRRNVTYVELLEEMGGG